ncbi:MAG TPA: L-threonylcarbamoyladenylate synthase [Candidatus Saccharimonadales bacterium]|nr:L-threonylcarbamoyladenylate synthase [Candidatus Saccharimonadales bacterium]
MIYWNDKESLTILKTALNQDTIILASGDTVLGLWGRLTQKSFNALNDLKQRSGKPYLIVVGSTDTLKLFIDYPLSEKLQKLIAACWPGPVTLIFKARCDLPSWMTSPDGTIALRIPDHKGLLTLLHYYDGLFSTSANIAGHEIPKSIQEVDQQLLDKVGVICLDRQHELFGQSPSTILDCSSGDIRVVRSGAFPIDSLDTIID